MGMKALSLIEIQAVTWRQVKALSLIEMQAVT